MIFVSRGEEGEFRLRFEREAMLQHDNGADGSMWGTVTSSDRTIRARFEPVKPGEYSCTSIGEAIGTAPWIRSKT